MRLGARIPREIRSGHRPTDRPVAELEVFATGSTELSRGADPAPDPAADERAAGDPHDPTAAFHARPGPRPGGSRAVTASRSGGATDIVRPLLVSPATASEIALSGGVFELPIPHLRLLPADQGDDRYLVWHVVVVAPYERSVPATLHLLGSPSMVVTVLELVPSRRLRWAGQHFIRHGVEALDILARRIEHAAA